jgi:hypothetical protein
MNRMPLSGIRQRRCSILDLFPGRPSGLGSLFGALLARFFWLPGSGLGLESSFAA